MSQCRMSGVLTCTAQRIGQHACECGFTLDLRQFMASATEFVDSRGNRTFRGRMPAHENRATCKQTPTHPMPNREPETMEEWGVAVGILLGPERARNLADLLQRENGSSDEFVDGLLFSAAQDRHSRARVCVWLHD